MRDGAAPRTGLARGRRATGRRAGGGGRDGGTGGGSGGRDVIPSRHRSRFLALYVLLATALVGASAGFVVLLGGSRARPPASWSSWSPPRGDTLATIRAIAAHVQSEYRLSPSAGRLVAVAAKSPPVILDGSKQLLIAEVAVRQTGGAIQTFDTAGTVMFTLCGAGADCSIAGGQPSLIRGRLVRREALELALDAFQYASRVQSVIAFLPPAPGELPSVSLYFQRQAFAAELRRPLAATLPLARPPLPTDPDPREAHEIDALTLKVTHVFHLASLQSGGAVLILQPLPL